MSERGDVTNEAWAGIEEDLTLAVKVDEEVMSTFHYKGRF